MKSVKSGRFQVKSTQNLIKSDVSAKTLQFGGVHGGGYDPRFHEIQGHSPSPAFIKLNSFCWNIWIYKVLGGFHLKSAGFHVKSKDLLARNCNPMFYVIPWFMIQSWTIKIIFVSTFTVNTDKDVQFVTLYFFRCIKFYNSRNSHCASIIQWFFTVPNFKNDTVKRSSLKTLVASWAPRAQI